MKDILQGVVFVGLFLIPFLPIYVENSFFFPFITGKNFAFRIIVEVIFASWVLLALYDEQYRPRFSWILAGFASLLGVMAVANALAEYPLQSFWSNFERMDGYVTLVHLFLFIVVAGSVLTTKKLWTHFFHLSAAIALLVALHGLGQYFGIIDGPASSRIRIDSRLGNAAYMAVYMLFHIFILFWLLVRSKVNLHKALYATAAVVLAVTLLYTGTRGTFLGFVFGSGVMVGYVALFGRAYPELRKFAIGSCVVILLLAGGFFAIKDSNFVQSNGALARIANIDLGKDLVTRGTIWGMAMEGVKERPVLGWGQSNFNYVFNEQYEASLYAGEAWFDRTHNIVLDWLIAGGVLGLLAYFSIFIAALYYLVWQPFFRKDEDPSFNVLERGVLIGLLAGYLVHNIVVFDNIISYIFYGSILALIHAHVSTKVKAVESFKMNPQLIGQFAAPIVILVMGATVYFVNAPGIAAAGDIIDAMMAPTVEARLREFHSALSRNSFAQQEIVEQLAQQAMNVVRTANVPEEEKKAIVQRAELELLKLIEEKPGDARLHAFLSSFYRTIGALPQAQEQAARARELSPNKPALVIEQGIVEIQLGNTEKATEYLKEAFELEESNTQARVLYASILVGSGKIDEARALLGEEYLDEFAMNDFALSMVDQSKDRALLAEMFEIRVAKEPQDPQNHASLAFIYYELGMIDKAIEVLKAGGEAVPSFAPSAQCFVGNLEKGVSPELGCQP
jgi:O-antigen ligase/tetratricopeptide (TPR) repeat protein